MIGALWGVLAILLVLMIAAWLVLLGVVRALDDLQSRMTGYSPDIQREGLNVGSIAPALSGPTVDGRVFSSDDVGLGPLFLVFVHPGCAPCETLVPQIFMAFAAFQLPGTTVVVSRGTPEDQPAGWRRPLRGNGARLEVVLELDGEISESFNVQSRPFCYLVGPDGKIVARSVINSANEILALAGKRDRRLSKIANSVGGAVWVTTDPTHSGTSTKGFPQG
jgi:hypothetical protein